jgi:hypothetical protein
MPSNGYELLAKWQENNGQRADRDAKSLPTAGDFNLHRSPHPSQKVAPQAKQGAKSWFLLV